MAQVGRGDPTREPMAGAGHLLGQDEKKGYGKKGQPGVALGQ